MIHVPVNKSHILGFTLVEILIFVTLISIIFVTFSALTAVSINKEQVNEHKILSSHYGEELREWMRGQKEIDWDSFVSTKMGTWCFNTEPVTTWPQTQGACSSYGLKSLFKREATLTANSDNTQVNELLTLTWSEGSNIFHVPLSTLLTIYE